MNAKDYYAKIYSKSIAYSILIQIDCFCHQSSPFIEKIQPLVENLLKTPQIFLPLPPNSYFKATVQNEKIVDNEISKIFALVFIHPFSGKFSNGPLVF